MARELVGLLVLNALLLAAGAGILVAARWCPVRATWRFFGLAYATGVAYAGVAGTLLLIVGFSWSRAQFIGAVALPWLVHAGRRKLGGMPPRERQARSGGSGWIKLASVCLASITVVKSISQPLSAWDAWSFWTPKSESIVYFHGLSAAYLHSGVANPDYPFLVPSLESLAFRFMGTFDTTLVHLQFALLLLAFVAGITEVIGTRSRGTSGAFIAVLVAVAPTVVVQTLSAYADVPLAIFCGFGGLLLWRAVTERLRGALVLASVFLTAAVATKAEGIIFLVIILGSVGIFAPDRRSATWRLVGVGSASALATAIPWHLWLAANHISAGYRFSLRYVVHQPDRSWRAFEAIAVHSVDPRSWLLLPLVVLAAIAAGLWSAEGRRAALMALTSLVGSFVALDFVYWGTSYPFQWHVNTSAERVITTPLLLSAMLAAFLLSTCDVHARRVGRVRASAKRLRLLAIPTDRVVREL